MKVLVDTEVLWATLHNYADAISDQQIALERNEGVENATILVHETYKELTKLIGVPE